MLCPIKNILVVLKPYRELQLALRHAIEIAKNHQASITTITPLHDPAWHSLEKIDRSLVHDLKKKSEHQYQVWIDQLMDAYKAESWVSKKLIHWDQDLVHSIAEVSQQAGPFDLIVKSCGHSTQNVMHRLLTPQDWQLIHQSPAPLLMVRTERPWYQENALVTLSASGANLKDQQNNRHLIATAKWVQESFRLKLNVLSVFPETQMELSIKNGCESLQLSQAFERLREETLLSYTQNLNLLASQIHLYQGSMPKILEELSTSLNNKLLIIGRTHKEGLGELLNPDEKEQVLDQIHSDILIVDETVKNTQMNSQLRPLVSPHKESFESIDQVSSYS